MKRMFYNIKGAFLALVLAGTMSCQNYLNLTDPESLSDGNFPTNIDHIGLIVNSVYGVQHHWYFLGNYWAGYVMYCLDHTIDMQWHNDQEWIDISAGEVKAGNVKVTDPWTGLSLPCTARTHSRLRLRLWTTMRANACSSVPSTGGTCGMHYAGTVGFSIYFLLFL